MIFHYPTIEEIKKYASKKNINRRNVRYCKNCGKMYINGQEKDHKCVTLYPVNEYITKPKPRFFSLKGETNPIYFGLEWEIDGWFRHQSLADHVIRTNRGEFYCKYDSSVALEFVSHPMTLEYIKANWDKLFVPIAKEFHYRNVKAWNDGNCGAHIHMSRNVLSEEQQWRMVNFFADGGNKDYLIAISGRGGDNPYCTYNPYTIVNNYKHSSDRYAAINFTPNTVEFRMFRGTLKLERIMANYHFVDAFEKFTRKDRVLFWGGFHEFFRNLYPEHAAFYERHKHVRAFLGANENEEVSACHIPVLEKEEIEEQF